MPTGTVKWFSPGKGIGFIVPDDGSEDVFAHYTAISGPEYPVLEKNLKVRYDVTTGARGPLAKNIRPL